MMKFAFTTYSTPNWDIEEVVYKAVLYGYRGLEFRMLAGQPVMPEMPETIRRRVKVLCEDNGLDICVVGSGCKFSSADAAERSANVQQLREFIDLAAYWEAPIVRVFGGMHPDGASKDEVYGHVADGIAAVLPEAAAAGVKIALETHDDFSTSAAVAAVFELVNDPDLGCVWDMLHPYRFGETYRETFDVIRDRVVHVHFKNARQVGDRWEPSMPNDGELPLREIVDALRTSGYEGYLSLEHEDQAEPDRALREYSRKFRELVRCGEG